MGVIGVGEVSDLVDELADRGERAAPDRFLGNDVEPDLDLIDPGGVGGGEVDVIAGPSSEPALDFDVFMGAVIVDDEVDIEVPGHVGVDVLQEAQKLLMTMPRLALGEHLAGGHVEGGEEGGGAVTDVAMRDAFDVSEPKGQQRLGSLQRLGLALLIDAEHHRVVGWVEVESDDIVDLLDEERIGGELEVLPAMRLDIERFPDAVNRGLGHPRRVGHGTATPMRATVGRFGVERLAQQHHDFVIFDGARLSRPAFVVQAHEALGAEALAPLADRLAAGPNLFGDRLVIEPIGAQKHADPSGFQYERDAFFAGLIDRGFLEDQNFYIVTGDRHWQYHSIHPTGFEEFSTGALVDGNSRLGRNPGDPLSTDPDALIEQPYTSTEPSGGFLHVTVSPGVRPTVTFRFYDERGVLASYG